MREAHVYGTWPRRLWLPLIVLAGGCFPLLVALGQGPTAVAPELQGPRASFGAVKAGNEKTVPPAKDAKTKKAKGEKDGGILLYAMPLTPPTADLLFRLDSEAVFRDRLRTEVRNRFPKLQLEFPESDAPAVARPPARVWPAYVKWVEPNYVLSKRLFFEQPYFERYGETVGFLQPVVSTGIFGLDMTLWPARRLARPFQCYQVNTDCYSPYFQMVAE